MELHAGESQGVEPEELRGVAPSQDQPAAVEHRSGAADANGSDRAAHLLETNDTVDVEAYLARIGYRGSLEPTAATLRALTSAHTHTVPFENLAIQLGGAVHLDLHRLQAKLVYRGRGGYCHEQNPLFGAVLAQIGFPVEFRSARMLMGADESTIDAVGHTLLEVTADGKPWMVDVGVGNTGPLEPLPLVDGTHLHQGSWAYRLDRSPAGRWVLRLWRGDGWFTLYQFSDEPYYPADIRDHNYVAATHPDSPFVRHLVVDRNGSRERWSLVDRRLDIHRPGQPRTRHELPASEVPNVLASRFGLTLTPEESAQLVVLLDQRG
ncbi:arylamine N-acetyltransferase [Lipingzhangella sp. LS1_29]|uniref:Arylamine N-acetyltransferase n=1 Tax=Lipingzhangella rawalii TaxID=2055835 RepID=A0ABU2H879_9ACTN|nr:arylamine N-acetyltransferase [Lipingzhangella rawalii]MDS1271511.1 arylamine N-acetyltransferase [Lipingzhangella rawalii]